MYWLRMRGLVQVIPAAGFEMTTLPFQFGAHQVMSSPDCGSAMIIAHALLLPGCMQAVDT